MIRKYFVICLFIVILFLIIIFLSVNSAPFALVVSEQQVFSKDKANVTRSVVSAVVSRIDLLNFIANGSGSPPAPGL